MIDNNTLPEPANRQIVLDTETTGLEPKDGHRVIEIGALEMIERRPTGKKIHLYLNPQRSVEEGAQKVHGLTDDFLRDKPVFGDIVDEFIEFCRDAELIIHNAEFDIGFLDNELKLCNESLGCMRDYCTVLDSLTLAREMHPGQRNGLDALCNRYDVDNSSRTFHGALLDAELLLDVYLAMTGGQSAFDLDSRQRVAQARDTVTAVKLDAITVKVPETEQQLHQERLRDITESSNGNLIWEKVFTQQ